jgi:hypothetical protein
MALSKSEKGVFSASAALALAVVLSGCSGKDSHAADGVGESARVCRAAPFGDTPARWVVDRIEEGAAAGEGIAVLENLVSWPNFLDSFSERFKVVPPC